MIRFETLPASAALNPNQCARIFIPPAYSDLHPVKSFSLKSMAIFAVVAACLFLVSLVGWAAFISNAGATLMMPLVVGIGIFAGFKIGDIATGEIR